MSRRYSAAIRVWCDADEPVRVRWRNRDLRVTGVLARWVEAQPWWQSGAAAEQQVWRVELTGRPGAVQVAELGECGGRWTLRSVAD